MRTLTSASGVSTPTPQSSGAPIRQAVWLALLIGVVFCATPPGLHAQSARLALGADYNALYSNAPPGECGCFWMNGGDGWLGFHLVNHLSAVFQAAGEHASNINGTSADLTLISYLAGPRFSLFENRRVQPFAQALFGGAYASGPLTPTAAGTVGAANVFAFSAGGGMDVGVGSHVAIRFVDVDYLYTRFNNGVNQHQDNLRLSAGIVFRFGSPR